MSETRQQRRARERQKAKRQTGRGPNIVKPVRVYDVELYRNNPIDDGDDVSWYAEWGLRDSSIGTEDSSEDLAELIASIIDDLRGESARFTVHVAWHIDGDPPPEGTIREAIAAENVELPEVLT